MPPECHDPVVPRQTDGVHLDPEVPAVGVHAVGARPQEGTEGAVRRLQRCIGTAALHQEGLGAVRQDERFDPDDNPVDGVRVEGAVVVPSNVTVADGHGRVARIDEQLRPRPRRQRPLGHHRSRQNASAVFAALAVRHKEARAAEQSARASATRRRKGGTGIRAYPCDPMTRKVRGPA